MSAPYNKPGRKSNKHGKQVCLHHTAHSRITVNQVPFSLQIPCDVPGCKAILTGDLPRHKKRVHNKERYETLYPPDEYPLLNCNLLASSHHFCEFEDCNRSKEGFYSFSALKVHVQSVQ